MATLPNPASAQTQTKTQTAPKSRIALVRERAFSLLQRLARVQVEAPDAALLKIANFEARLMSRYHATTESEELDPRVKEARLAALLHHDLQLALIGIESRDAKLQKRGERIAGLIDLHLRWLPSDPQLNAAIYEGFLLPGLSAAPATGWGNASSLLEGAAMAFRAARQGEQQVEVLRQLLATQVGATASGAESSGAESSGAESSGADTSKADLTRIHLTDALASDSFHDGGSQQVIREKRVARLSEAIALLEAVKAPDLLGAKSRLPELRLELEQLPGTPKVPIAKNEKTKP